MKQQKTSSILRIHRQRVLTLCICCAAFLLFGCSSESKKDDLPALVKSSAKARAGGHEDAAANDLKEAFERLPQKGSARRIECINQLYPETIELSILLRQLGRLSLANTMLDKAIEIEPECTIQDKQSAVALKKETERVGEMEATLIKRADKAKELRDGLKELKHTTRDLSKLFARGDFEQVARDGRKHLEILRKSRGAASNAYCDARRLVVESMLQQDNIEGAIKLLEDDVNELSNFKDNDLRNGDEEAVESAMYLAPLLGEIANLEVTVGRFDEAEKNALRSFELAKIMGGKASPDSNGGQLAYAAILQSKGKNKEALDAANAALPFFQRSRANRALRVRCLYTIAHLQEALGNTKLAKKGYDHLILEAKENPQPGSSSISLALAAAFYRTQTENEYSKLKDEAIKLASRKGEPKSSIQVMYETLGDSSVRFSKFTEAQSDYEKALKYAPEFQKENLQKKIDMCKKNRSVTS